MAIAEASDCWNPDASRLHARARIWTLPSYEASQVICIFFLKILKFGSFDFFFFVFVFIGSGCFAADFCL